MIFLASVAATLVFFDHSGDIIHINISTSVGVEPTNAANIYMDYVSTVVEKDKCRCYRCEKYHNSAQDFGS